jgi:outer membrane protein OmpA-like peptidoglycan-associated protein
MMATTRAQRLLTSGLRPLLASTAVLGLALACASGPNRELMSAESAYEAAASDARVSEHAPVALREAEQAVERAREAQRDGEDQSEVEHLAYLANRRVEIAREEADRKAALDASRELGQEQRVVGAEQRAENLAAELERIRAQQTDRGLVLSLDDVLFAVDEAALQPGALPDLSRIAEFLRENPERSVLVEGHTDSTGSADYNLRLSEARAASVESVLIRNGVSPDRIRTRGLGQSVPVASNQNAAGRQQNRRVEIVIAEAPQVGAGPR